MSINSIKRADAFLSISSQYKLGDLITESAHPATRNLSSLSSEKLPEAISILKEIDSQTISILCEHKSEIYHLKEIITDTLEAGSNIYFCGCGATGRLSLSIETIWRQVNKEIDIKDRVFSFMAGGDVALIRSIENFEDFPDYGARQLIEAGFGNDDLLIGSTEGGETPFVIGAVEKASEISGRKPFFLYCNPDDILCEVAERSRLVIENPDIEKINLTVGPMAITGSTRMQSSTILLAAAGIALLYYGKDNSQIDMALEIFKDYWNSVDIQFIEKFIIKETDFYRSEDYLLYETDNQLGITVITDTTERSPTFSLFPFENVNEDDQKISLCYLYMPDKEDSKKAWSSLLWRDPRTLEWPDINGIASRNRLLGFDFSKNFLVRKVVYDSFFKVKFYFCTDFGRRKIYHDLNRFFEGEFIHGIVNIFFCIRIKFFFMERRRVKRIKELHQAIEFKFDHNFSVMLPVVSFRSFW